MTDYVPTTEEVEESFIYQQYDVNGRFESAELAGRAFDRWLAEHERQVAERAWWEACLRIAEGENDVDIAHVYQKQNPYTKGEEQ